jgi:capsular polysaccharide biosynthesis protein
MDTKELDLKEIIGMLTKRLWLIILIPVIAVGIAGYVNFKVFVPMYQANTTVLIAGLYNVTPNTDSGSGGTAGMSFEDIVAGQYLVSEYSEIIRSKRVTSTVVKILNDGLITEDELANMISISSVNDTRLINISILHPDPVKAAQIADVVADAFSKEVGMLYSITNINIIDKAEVPTAPVTPTKKKNIAITGLAALIAAIGIAFLIEFLDNTVKTSDDVERHLGLHILGSIPVNTLDKGKNK